MKPKTLAKEVLTYMNRISSISVHSPRLNKNGETLLIRYDSSVNPWEVFEDTLDYKDGVITAKVLAYPIDVKGTLLIDGNYQPVDSLSTGNASQTPLQQNPLIWKIRDQVIRTIYCLDEGIKTAAREAIFETKDGQQVGETRFQVRLSTSAGSLDERVDFQIGQGKSVENPDLPGFYAYTPNATIKVRMKDEHP